jgi:hypothetical protein
MPDVAAARQFVVDALMEHGATVFTPVAKAPGIDFLVRTSDRKYVELRVASSDARSFQAGNFKPHSAFYILGVVQQPGAGPEAWVLPSPVVERYGERSSNGYMLDVDGPLGEQLDTYRERWTLITEFSKYEQVARDPSSLKVRLALDA